eukprot:CAMPEP_0168363316 /NCGR_PEP_ID=MMETSP0228-20121227/3627_1 /TAXON_ID=133427 /ORGANISM="Protoceratium reticulatum, Strain CCCM 535 (=CCMP 1889)" /LENGTH=587 /DNA_ID=CAMNT_0008376037 /DNA_START=184 /DNA_END=1947 /DNA_ORIENTATION=+
MEKSADGVFEVKLNALFRDEFNAAYDELKRDIARTLGLDVSFLPILIGSWIARILQCYVAWSYSWFWALGAGFAQFLAAPLSFTSSLVRLLTNLSDCILHYAINGLMVFVVLYAAPAAGVSLFGTYKIKFGITYVVSFFVVDFIANLYHYLATSERFGCGRLLTHILYGSFNTKTYFVVVLGCVFGLEVDLGIWLATGALQWSVMEKGYGEKLLRRVSWPSFFITFYVEHRIGHCPIVYSHAHKMHHYLHDSTAFDAHIYGSGMNEEYFWICAEVLPCVLSKGLLFPYFFNLYTLYVSWTNKSGHTRDDLDRSVVPWGCDADNFHADHHTFHRANFGTALNPMLDFYFGTQSSITKRVNGRSWQLLPGGQDLDDVRYLPEFGNDGQRLLQLESGSQSYKVIAAGGIAYRSSPNMDCHHPVNDGPKLNDVVNGELSGGWLTVRVPQFVLRVAPMAVERRLKQAELDAALAAAGTDDVERSSASVSRVQDPADWRSRVISGQELAQMTGHDQSPLWVALCGAVFDLTAFQRLHPGGAAVLRQYAGTDSTQTYAEVAHPDRAKKWAMKYVIGRFEGASLEGFVAELAGGP